MKGHQMSESDPRSAHSRQNTQLIGALVTLVVFVAALVFAFAQLATQSAEPLDAPANEFSATRAMQTLDGMAGTNQPRPLGSAENARVRELLVSKVEALGYAATLQDSTYTSQATSATKNIAVNPPENRSPLETARTINVLVRVPGTDAGHGEAVLIAGHYDSVPSGPGASDDGHSVAAMVEVLRAMKSSPPLKHDVIFLMTDGEEPGERGARAFVAEHPWAKDVRFVANFEARGNKGRDLFFEAGAMSPNVLSAYTASQPLPQTGSLFYEIFKRLKNNTDFSVFTALDKPGLSFAYIVGLNRYHTPGDSVENISTGSVQYAGSMMLGLVTHLGNQDSLQPAPAEEITWFNIGTLVVSYGTPVSFVLILLGLGVWIGALVTGVRRRTVTVGSVGRGASATLLSVVVAIVVCQLALALISLVTPANRPWISMSFKSTPDPYPYEWFGAGIAALVVAATFTVFGLLARKAPVASVALGALAVWGLLAIVVQLVARPAAYVFVVPFLLLSIAVLIRVIWDKPWVTLIAELIAASLVLVFIVPIVATSLFALSLSMAAAMGLFAALITASLYSALSPLTQLGHWLAPAVVGVLGVVLVVTGLATTTVGPNHRLPNTLVYSIDSNANTATWLSYDESPDEWTETVLGADPPRQPAPQNMVAFFPSTLAETTVMHNPAKSVLPVSAPIITVTSDKIVSGERAVEFTTASTRDAINLSYSLVTSGELKTIKIGDQQVPIQAANSWSVIGYAPPKEGYKVSVTLTAGSSLEITATDMTYGFPDDPVLGFAPRPDWSMWHQEPHAFQFDPVMVTTTLKAN